MRSAICSKIGAAQIRRQDVSKRLCPLYLSNLRPYKSQRDKRSIGDHMVGATTEGHTKLGSTYKQGHFRASSRPTDEYQGTAALAADFERHKDFTSGLRNSSSTPADPLRIREALLFFTAQKTSAYASKHNMLDVPNQCIQKILDHLDQHYFSRKQNQNPGWIHSIVVLNSSVPCGVLINTMQHFMEPFKGTAYTLRNHGYRRRRREEIHQSEHLAALQEATRIKRFILSLVGNPACLDIVYDLAICHAFLELWDCRTWYLGRCSASDISPEVSQLCFEGASHSNECVDAMLRFIMAMKEGNDGLPQPDQTTYKLYIHALAVSEVKGAAQRAHRVLVELENEEFPTTLAMYNEALLAYSNEVKVEPEAVNGAKELFQYMLSSESPVQPDPVTMSTLLNVYSRARLPNETEDLLLDFEKNAQKFGFAPSRIGYNTVINSWAKSLHKDGVAKAFALFRRMSYLAESGLNPEASPDTITYTILIDAFARNPSTGKHGLEQAETLLEHAESGHNPRVVPDATMYRTYMAALSARLGRQKQSYSKANVAAKIEAVLHRMRMKSKEETPSTSPWHNTSIYNTAIAAWSKTRNPDAIERAVELFNDLRKECKAAGHPSSLQPDMETYHSLLTCLGTRQNTGDYAGVGPKAVAMARRVLREIEENGFPLTIGTINLYLKVLSVSGIPDAIMQAEQALQSLEEDFAAGRPNAVPNEFSYLYIMDGYAKMRDGAERAERLLNQMVFLSNQYPSRRSGLAPSVGSFNIVMDAWSRSGRSNAVENVWRIMHQLEDYGRQPDTYAYTTLIAAYARDDCTENAPEQAEALLTKMQEDYDSGKNPTCKPNNVSFASVLKCWTKSGKEGAPERSEAIVRRMKDLSSHKEYSDLDLNYSCLRLAIMAWLHATGRRPDAGTRATGLLDLVDESFAAGKLEPRYAIHCYNSVIATVARSWDGEKAAKAYNLLNRMQRNGLSPRARDFRAVLSACNETASVQEATDLQKQEAFRIANITFLEYLESNLNPDVEVYKEMISLHTTLMIGDDVNEKRGRLITAIFSKSPPTIQHSGAIRSAMRAALSTEMYDKLVAKADSSNEQQPGSLNA